MSISGACTGNAILQEIDVSHRKTAEAVFRWQSIDFVDALRRSRSGNACKGTENQCAVYCFAFLSFTTLTIHRQTQAAARMPKTMLAVISSVLHHSMLAATALSAEILFMAAL